MFLLRGGEFCSFEMGIPGGPGFLRFVGALCKCNVM